MTRAFIALIILGVLLIGFTLYRSRGTHLNVDPHTREQIEKARQR